MEQNADCESGLPLLFRLTRASPAILFTQFNPNHFANRQTVNISDESTSFFGILQITKMVILCLAIIWLIMVRQAQERWKLLSIHSMLKV